jgi:hypothetical protein
MLWKSTTVELFSQSLRLSSVILTEQFQEYKMDEVEYWKPVVMPRLRYMRLNGPSTLQCRSIQRRLDMHQNWDLELQIFGTFVET